MFKVSFSPPKFVIKQLITKVITRTANRLKVLLIRAFFIKVEKELHILTPEGFKRRGYDPMVFPSAPAADVIRQHKKCPFDNFHWTGECLVKSRRGDYDWYYVVGDGPLHDEATQVILWQK